MKRTDPGPGTAWLWTGPGLRGRSLVVEAGRDIRALGKARGSDGRRGLAAVRSAAWHIPRGRALILYDDRDHQGGSFALVGTGSPLRLRDLGAAGFPGPCASARWLGLGEPFRFHPSVLSGKEKILSAHEMAYDRIPACGFLTRKQKARLLQTYWRPIGHYGMKRDGPLGRARVGGDLVGLNKDLLESRSPALLAPVLIHEMMHCAGYTHARRTDDGVPWDRGSYYRSPPVQAEHCIIGGSTPPPPLGCRALRDGEYVIELGGSAGAPGAVA